MADMSDRRREPKGIPTGGRFAAGKNGSADADDLGGERDVPWTMPPLPPRPQAATPMPPLPPRPRVGLDDPFGDYDRQQSDKARALWLATHLERGDPGSVDLAVYAITSHRGRLSDDMVDAISYSGCVRRADGSVDASAAKRVAHALMGKQDLDAGRERTLNGWYEPGVPGEGQAASEVMAKTRNAESAEAALSTILLADDPHGTDAGARRHWISRLAANPSYPRYRSAAQVRRAMMSAPPVVYGLVPEVEAAERTGVIVSEMAAYGLARL